ncbi:probable RNA polymerase II nuclear localization protein SLC7A6OS [Pieris rapae]|uniref:probable RNA polymerase II nuclear localization protein SLC7A6OS n=1 Tax=Pieris rapae TaxID=64459 RepID=UPI001E27D587|nr:probable RNA polymerase II nuclear localization protein SLC7A6OS [Pieris rapae]
MASATVLRVKRSLDDNPQDALVLLCKRRKTNEEEISPSLFVFRGSVDNQEAADVKDIVPKADFKLKPKTDVDEIIKKIRQERKEASGKNRYEVVNCSRGLEEDSINLVDLHQPNLLCDTAKYTYDLYTSVKKDFDISMIDNLVSIENYETDLILDTYKDNGLSSSDADDDDDSNDENNWRNDYPDSEPSSLDEDDMVAAMKRCDLDDLSTDEEGDIYTDPPDLLNDDVKKYGAAYAKYKAKVLAEENTIIDSKNLIHSTKIKDLDEESIDGYKEESDDGFYYGQDEDSKQFCEQYPDEVYNPD